MDRKALYLQVAQEVRETLSTSDFKDFANFQLFCRKPKNAKWIGMYRGHSFWNHGKAIISLNLNYPLEICDIEDTIFHEIGHAVWDTVDDFHQNEWYQIARYDKYGHKETFADNFMYLMTFEKHFMSYTNEFLNCLYTDPKSFDKAPYADQ